jgi:ADP-ribose pyrophosphatase YjhB (NUDIX family)
LPNEVPVDATVRDLFEETVLTLIVEDLTLSSSNHVRVPLPKHQLVYVFSASLTIPYVIATLRTPAKVERVVTIRSTIHSKGSYVFPATVDIDVLSLTPSRTGLVKEIPCKIEMLHFGYVA